MRSEKMLRTVVVLVEDRPGVLNRVASLFRRRAFNIESLTVGRTEAPGVSRMTIVVNTDEGGARRLEAHLYKLVNVLKIDDLTDEAAVSRDLAMIKVAASTESLRSHVMLLVNVFRARVLDVSRDSMIIECTGTEEKVDRLVEMLTPYGVIEMARTGRVSMARGAQAIETYLVTSSTGAAADAPEDDNVSYSV